MFKMPKVFFNHSSYLPSLHCARTRAVFQSRCNSNRPKKFSIPTRCLWITHSQLVNVSIQLFNLAFVMSRHCSDLFTVFITLLLVLDRQLVQKHFTLLCQLTKISQLFTSSMSIAKVTETLNCLYDMTI